MYKALQIQIPSVFFTFGWFTRHSSPLLIKENFENLKTTPKLPKILTEYARKWSKVFLSYFEDFQRPFKDNQFTIFLSYFQYVLLQVSSTFSRDQQRDQRTKREYERPLSLFGP